MSILLLLFLSTYIHPSPTVTYTLINPTAEMGEIKISSFTQQNDGSNPWIELTPIQTLQPPNLESLAYPFPRPPVGLQDWQ